MYRISNSIHILALFSIMITQLRGDEITLQQVYETSYQINCISEDQYSQVSGSLLLCEDHRLLSFNYPEYNSTNDNITRQSIVGSIYDGYSEGVNDDAAFRGIYDIAHLDSNTELLIDHGNECLRTVDRTSNRTETFAGLCESNGTADGSFKDARFSSPYRMSKLGDFIYVTGWTNSVIRVLDLTKRQVSTLSLAGFVKNPSGIALKTNQPSAVLITFEHGIAEYNTDTGITLLLAGADTAADSVNQSLQDAFDSPRDIVAVGSNRFLIADRNNGKVKLLDIDQNWTTLVTASTPEVTTIDLLNGVVFIGCHNTSTRWIIYKFDLHSSFIQEATAVTETLTVTETDTTMLAKTSTPIIQLEGNEITLQQVYRTSHQINCIIDDQFSQVPGYLVVCEGDRLVALKVESGITNSIADIIVGYHSGYGEGVNYDAAFRGIYDIAHLDSNTEVVIDHGNECLRTVDRLLNRTETFAGLCGTIGTADGSFKDARFHFPYRMSKLGDFIYITGWTSSVIRVLDLIKRQVSTLSLAGFVKNPSGIAINANQPSAILITFEHGIAEYNTDTGITLLLAGADRAADSVNQSLQSAFDSPRDIVAVAANRLLIADRDNGKVKLLDIDQNWITLVTASTPKVTAIDLLNGTVFVGCQNTSTSKIIYKFDLHSSFIQEANTVSEGAEVIEATAVTETLTVEETGTTMLAKTSTPVVQLIDGEVTLQPVRETSYQINCISEDLYVPGNLLVCEGDRLITLNATSGLSEIIVGNFSGYAQGIGTRADFLGIYDISHISSETEVVIDHGNGCLRTVDRTSNRTETFAGLCGTVGTADGSFENTRFYFPYRMIKLGDFIYVTGWTNSVIRLIDLINRQVSTLSLANFVRNPSGVAIKPYQPTKILITFEHGIAEYNKNTGITLLRAGAGTAADSVNQSLRDAFDSPRDIVALASNRFLIADRNNGKVKQLDIDQNWITLVTASTPRVSTIDVLNDEVFVGCQIDSRKNVIYKLVKLVTSETVKPVTSETVKLVTSETVAIRTNLTTSSHNKQPAIVPVLVCSVQLLLLILI